MTAYGFFVNTDICTGCKACMTSCFDRNDLEVPQKFRKVYEFGGGTWSADEAGAYTQTAFGYYVSMTCGQCERPACMAACPVGALSKDEDTGIVSVDYDLCTGCMSCEKACPYGHPTQMADGFSHKCVMCTDRKRDGEPDPACVKACPVRALEFGAIGDLRAAHGDLRAIGELDDVTGPNVVFKPHRDADKGGILANPLEVGHEQ